MSIHGKIDLKVMLINLFNTSDVRDSLFVYSNSSDDDVIASLRSYGFAKINFIKY